MNDNAPKEAGVQEENAEALLESPELRDLDSDDEDNFDLGAALEQAEKKNPTDLQAEARRERKERKAAREGKLANLMKLTKKTLRARCKKAGVSQKGTKAELARRLVLTAVPPGDDESEEPVKKRRRGRSNNNKKLTDAQKAAAKEREESRKDNFRCRYGMFTFTKISHAEVDGVKSATEGSDEFQRLVSAIRGVLPSNSELIHFAIEEHAGGEEWHVHVYFELPKSMKFRISTCCNSFFKTLKVSEYGTNQFDFRYFKKKQSNGRPSAARLDVPLNVYRAQKCAYISQKTLEWPARKYPKKAKQYCLDCKDDSEKRQLTPSFVLVGPDFQTHMTRLEEEEDSTVKVTLKMKFSKFLKGTLNEETGFVKGTFQQFWDTCEEDDQWKLARAKRDFLAYEDLYKVSMACKYYKVKFAFHPTDPSQCDFAYLTPKQRRRLAKWIKKETGLKWLVFQGLNRSAQGKTQLAEALFGKDGKPLVIKSLGDLAKFSPQHHTHIVVDDVLFCTGWGTDEFQNLFDPRGHGSTTKLKFVLVKTIPAGTPVIFCTNKPLFWDNQLDDDAEEVQGYNGTRNLADKGVLVKAEECLYPRKVSSSYNPYLKRQRLVRFFQPTLYDAELAAGDDSASDDSSSEDEEAQMALYHQMKADRAAKRKALAAQPTPAGVGLIPPPPKVPAEVDDCPNEDDGKDHPAFPYEVATAEEEDLERMMDE